MKYILFLFSEDLIDKADLKKKDKFNPKMCTAARF